MLIITPPKLELNTSKNHKVSRYPSSSFGKEPTQKNELLRVIHLLHSKTLRSQYMLFFIKTSKF